MKITNEIIYFVFPLLFSGLIHHIVIIKYNLFPSLSTPFDFNIFFNNKPLLGKSKTWRGLLLVPILSGIGSLIISQFIYIPTILPVFIVGILLGLGYAIAELPNSFIKRRFDINAGEKANNKFRLLFTIIDQVDSVIGTVIVMLIIYPAGIELCISTLIIGVFLHLLVDLYLYRHGYKKLRNKKE